MYFRPDWVRKNGSLRSTDSAGIIDSCSHPPARGNSSSDEGTRITGACRRTLAVYRHWAENWHGSGFESAVARAGPIS